MSLPKTPKALHDDVFARLQAGEVLNAEKEARIILQARAGLGWADVLTESEAEIDPDILKQIESDLNARLQGKPLSRIYSTCEFWGMEFSLNAHTLEPRPDTETLIERALALFGERPPSRFLELGTGTGCISSSLLKAWPESYAIVTDYSPGALVCAAQNFETHGLQGRAHMVCADWFAPIQGQFELVVSNPPYIEAAEIESLSPEVQNHDPILALSGGQDGLDAYRIIFHQLFSMLKPGGTGLFEIGYTQGESAARLAEESRFSVKHVHADLAGRPRVVEISRGDK